MLPSLVFEFVFCCCVRFVVVFALCLFVLGCSVVVAVVLALRKFMRLCSLSVSLLIVVVFGLVLWCMFVFVRVVLLRLF